MPSKERREREQAKGKGRSDRPFGAAKTKQGDALTLPKRERAYGRDAIDFGEIELALTKEELYRARGWD